MKILKYIIIILIIVIISIIAYVCFIPKKVTTVININNNLTFDYQSEVYLYDLVDIIDGEIINQNYLLDTSSIGNKEITFNYKDNNKKKNNYSFNINIVDNISPIISLSKNIYLEEGNTLDYILNKTFYGDNCDREVEIKIDGEYDVNTIGNYDIVVSAVDDSNNKTSINTTLHVYKKTNSNNNSNTSNNLNNGTDIKYFIKNYKTDNTSIGLDLSSYQSVSDFNLLKNQGIDFVILRLGWGPIFNDNNSMRLDNTFEDFYNRAKDAGLKVGVYVYSYAVEDKDIDIVSNFVLDNLKGKDIDLFVAYDFENWTYFKDYKANFYDLNMSAKKFLDKIKDNGYNVMNYGSYYYLKNIWNLDNYDVWLAHYNLETNFENFNIWQITDSGKVDGINSLVDVDILVK